MDNTNVLLVVGALVIGVLSGFCSVRKGLNL